MEALKIIFWILLFIAFYTYVGYGILLYVIIKIRRFLNIGKKVAIEPNYEPEVTLFIAAYNEKDYVEAKMKNSLELDYPKEKLNIVWVTDGSDDGTPDLLKGYPNTTVHHLDARNGKIGAMNRGMEFVKTPIVVFSDANTNLGKESIRRIVNLFGNEKVGCVSGEKRIINKESDVASGAGEGLYWKYESALKKWDAELYSVVGAAGELFAIRTDLYRHVEKDTLLDDFIISLRVAQDGYTIQYDPEAYAIETASANVNEELKRKIRISAGGIQSVVRLSSLLNIFKYGTLSFQYISHRVLRWTLTPLCLVLLIPVSFVLAYNEGIFDFGLYSILFWLQILFYIVALTGWFLENRSTRIKALFVPYYFFIMNLSVVLGFFRYMKKSQSVNWERAKRAQ
ncbi:Glycosyltransferase, catalytic subunit of cellulose synthase and poly-beta-1,6-N-acetylglucosamine synthase [Lutibacter agarilyticus]|uniref:Glycosyltransferase, catalytic subunit of cellulose synthase and poly-beta-1,6-N-acetylglucosamine synthase n=1 Tax=Lutibacter agarilyticus TaxID=1109740 RepID=A0A238XZE6_9FLAO|nr:glycosyltransferase family 2 protein [Lutibacter agarilyticus]SNR63901.1 Glycosyltransferase, catalytic subunit of cellulose synthase and poly-beta-1,6-N-acetylglucosamine synthase [Lutibacter agarilyticus]